MRKRIPKPWSSRNKCPITRVTDLMLCFTQRYDYVAILDELSNEVGKRHCGSYVYPVTVDVKGKVAIIVFRSDSSTGKRGFLITYTAHVSTSCFLRTPQTFITDRTAPVKLGLTPKQNMPLERIEQTKISKWTNCQSHTPKYREAPSI